MSKNWALGQRVFGGLLKEFYSRTPMPVLHTDTHFHNRTDAHLCVHALASADLQLLPSACPVAVAISWEGWMEGPCGCLAPRLLTPVTQFHLTLPSSPLPPFLPSLQGLVQTRLPICYLHRKVRALLAPALFSAWVTWLWLACFSLCSLKA